MTCRHLQIEVTSRCNLRCSTCLYGHYAERWVPGDLDDRLFTKIITSRASLRSVHLQGWGESLLRSDIPALVHRAHLAGMRVSLSSNGSIMDEKLARGLVAAGLDSLAFSFAGVTAADQDPLRGAGTFERAIQAAETFARSRGKSGRPPSLMNFLLLRSNGRQLGQAARLARRLGMARLQVGHLVQPVAPAQQSLLAYPNFKLPLGYLFGLRLATLWRRVEVVLPSLKSQPTPICPKNPLNQAFVGADGSVSPCVYLTPLFAYRCRA